MKGLGQRCGARRKHGRPGRCQRWGSAKNGRCYVHGGYPKIWVGTRNTGPLKRVRRIWLALRHAQGLKNSGGRPKQQKVVRTMAEEAKAVLVEAQGELAAVLPPDILTRDIATLSPAEALGRAALSGTYQLIRIIEQPMAIREKVEDAPPKTDELKLQRLIGDMSGLALNTLRRNATSERAGDALGELLAEIRAEKAARAK